MCNRWKAFDWCNTYAYASLTYLSYRESYKGQGWKAFDWCNTYAYASLTYLSYRESYKGQNSALHALGFFHIHLPKNYYF